MPSLILAHDCTEVAGQWPCLPKRASTLDRCPWLRSCLGQGFGGTVRKAANCVIETSERPEMIFADFGQGFASPGNPLPKPKGRTVEWGNSRTVLLGDYFRLSDASRAMRKDRRRRTRSDGASILFQRMRCPD